MRRPKPYYKKSHRAWYVNLNGRPKRLASEEEGEKAAWDKYDTLMAGRQPAGSNLRVGEVVQWYLDHHTNHSAPRTREFYTHALTSFLDFVGPNLRVSDLRVHHVTAWVDAQTNQGRERRVIWGVREVRLGGVPAMRNTYRGSLLKEELSAYIAPPEIAQRAARKVLPCRVEEAQRLGHRPAINRRVPVGARCFRTYPRIIYIVFPD
jgi:hypothetical protein